MQQITHKQAIALARFIAELRPDWDAPGVEAALGRARTLAPAHDVAIAAIKAASIQHNQTPAIIALEGPHWRGSEHTPRHEEPERHERCSVCQKRQAACESQRLAGDDHSFRPDVRSERPTVDVTATVAGLRTLLEPTATPPAPEPLPAIEDRNPAAVAVREAVTAHDERTD
ncbi:hypothetical protein LRP67_16360 [Nocardioides sp. cx-169]|uniref:hypothetical protein n=1 Tax=Nocardioides sp. cx-169 TaxID=2899080 RepID=UPI001E4DA5D3|nr:hypothetical protein [Nocardioides sp. cx-169]MCD4535667.1 hypothetical protein [Nocardioides sp. cx-169]